MVKKLVMKYIFQKLITVALLLFCTNLNASAQIEKYKTYSLEFIFSKANYSINENQISTPVRFTCFFHTSTNYHVDIGKYFGVFSGFGIRNVGFTSDHGDTALKRRNYYIGIPLAIKLGNLKEDNYVFGGIEGEMGLNYKEKLFIHDKKVSVSSEWFSDKTPLFMPSVFAGINFKSGLNIKVKYYLKDFLKNGYDYSIASIPKYQSTQSQIYYLALSYSIRNSKTFRKTFNKSI